jgi:antitoxin component of RelBE/YafQ-DinJ toxin-antitoxin module
MGAETTSRSRRLLTFRLDRELRQRLKARLAGDGRTMSEVVILGLQLYVQRSTWLSGPGTLDLDMVSDVTPALPEAAQAVESPGLPAATEVPVAVPAAAAAQVPAAAAKVPARVAAAAKVPARVAAEVAAADVPVAAAEVAAAGTTVVASAGDLVLPDQIAAYLRKLRESRNSDLLSAALAKLHDAGWPLRPLAVALGISRQAVQARIRQPVPAALRSAVPDVPPPSAFPRRRPALASGRRPHLTVKIDQALRSAAQSKAVREGSSLSQVIEKILNYYLRHGMPAGEVRLGDTTPARTTRPARPVPRRRRHARVPPAAP